MSPEPRFSQGQKVRALMATQGLREDRIYTVAEVHPRPTPFGTFVLYHLTDGDKTLPVRNGHLLLEEVK